MKKLNLITIILVTVAGLLVIAGSAFGVDALYIDANGKVGIGTMSPVGILHTKAASTAINILDTSTTGGQVNLQFADNGNNKWAIYKSTGNDLAIYDYQGTPGNRVTIKASTGNVGMGYSDPGGFKLKVYGTAYKSSSPSGGTWDGASDIRLKTNIKNLTNATEIISDYPKPIVFNWINPEQHEDQTREIIGLSAQELEAVNPELVVELDEDGKDAELTEGKTKVMHFSNEFFALQLGAVQELIERVEALETENQVIKKELCTQNRSYSFCK